jgi:nucleotide-binding universal stress UspA family protein
MPVLVARLTTPINSLQRVVLVVPPGCPIGALSEEMLEGIKTIARTLNVPLLVMGAPAELDGLTELIASRGEEYPFDTMPLREKVMQDVARRVRMQDMIVVPASGSRSRFRLSLGDIPEQLVATTPSSVVVIHYP